MAYRGLFAGKACQFTEDNDTQQVIATIFDGAVNVGTANITYNRILKENGESVCQYNIENFFTTALTAANTTLALQFPTAIPRPSGSTFFNFLANDGGSSNATGWLNVTSAGNWVMSFDAGFIGAVSMFFRNMSFVCYCTTNS